MNTSCGKTSGEELYCKGANAFDYGREKSKSAYVLDLSGRIGDAAYAAAAKAITELPQGKTGSGDQ